MRAMSGGLSVHKSCHHLDMVNWIIGDAAGAASALRTLADRHGIDEVMVSPIGGSYEAEPTDASPGREQTLELLAPVLGR